MLLVVRPPQAADQLQIVRQAVIRLAERRIGVQHIRILAQKIIVPIIVETGKRIGIDIAAANLGRSAKVVVLIAMMATALVRNA